MESARARTYGACNDAQLRKLPQASDWARGLENDVKSNAPLSQGKPNA